MPDDDARADLPMTLTLKGGPTVARLGFGAMRIAGAGVWGPPRDEAEAIAVLRRAVELGVNFIDTADSYGPGVSGRIGAGPGGGRDRLGAERLQSARPVVRRAHRSLQCGRDRVHSLLPARQRPARCRARFAARPHRPTPRCDAAPDRPCVAIAP